MSAGGFNDANSFDSEGGGEGGRPWLPRVHFYEINDQSWWPALLRTYVQDYLTLGWTVCLPFIQSSAPCAIAASILTSQLASEISKYTFIDFCSGSGGPTPFFEKHVNQILREEGKEEVRFVMSDIEPSLAAWEGWCKKSDSGRLGFVREKVDATAAPSREVLLGGRAADLKGTKIMRLFSLAFHHFDDKMARGVLKDTLTGSDGFCIFELQSRNLPSFIMVSLLWPLAMLLAPIYFWNSPGRLLFTYLAPLVPFVWVFDGYISCLRTRHPTEVKALMVQSVPAADMAKWKVKSGEVMHTFPIGKLYWIIGTKSDD